jgi:hypothetical protein
MNHDKRSVSLEDLLRLKRIERPPTEFWAQFDQQLRAKQLAALVEKRPWWHDIHQTFLAQLRRYQLPLGAAAALVVTFAVMRDDNAGSPEAVQSVVRSRVVSMPSTSALPEASANDDPVAEQAPASEFLGAGYDSGEKTAAQFVSDAPSSEESVAIEHERPTVVADVVSPFEALTGSRATVEETSPSARFIAANFAAAQSLEGVGPTLLSVSHGFESRALPARAATVEPLQQMTPPGEARRATRYLATMVSAATTVSSARTTERMANRISAEELYDQVRRFGARQGGFNVKF